jgi:ketosteroid isomerase-like protein
MPEPNAEILRRTLILLMEPGKLDDVSELIHPEIEVRPSPLEDNVFQGLDGFAKVRADLAALFSGLHVEILELREEGDSALAVAHVSCLSTKAGIPLDVDAGFVGRIQDGKLIHLEVFPDRTAALESLGLTD